MRSNEIKSLKWDSIDFDRRVIVIPTTKNGEAKFCPMSDEVHAMLLKVDQERKHKPVDFVFRSRYGRPWKSWRTAWEGACERANLSGYNFHELRHNFGSFLAAVGVQERLMELLGHKTAAMTKRYIHFANKYRQQAIDSLPTFAEVDAKTKSFEFPFEGHEDKVVS